MSIKIPGDVIPESTNLLDGIYDFTVESLEPIETSTGKLALKCQLRVLKGLPNTKGLVHYEMFTIGSNDDPGARETDTWASSFGAIMCRKLCNKAGVKFDGDLQKVARELEGQKVSGKIVYTVQGKFNKDGTENPYAGNARSQVKDWYEIGARVPGADEGAAKGAKLAVAAAPKKALKAPPPPDDNEEEEEEAEEEEEETPPKRGSKSRKPARTEDEDDED